MPNAVPALVHWHMQVYYLTDSSKELSRRYGDMLYRVQDLEVRRPQI